MPGKPFSRDQAITAFWNKVAITAPNDCWLWTAYKDRNGYGQFRFLGKTVYANRLSLELKLQRELLEGEYAIHLCDNPGCVNPRHLQAGTQADNIRDMLGKQRGLIGRKNGHAKLTEDDVRKIRRLYTEAEKKWGSIIRIARMFGVSHERIHSIVNGRAWKHVK